MFGIEPQGCLEFDADTIARGLALPLHDVLAYFRDGRRTQPIVERRLAHVLAGQGWTTKARERGGGTVFLDASGDRWDLRVATTELSVAPSHMKGKGRTFDAARFLAELGRGGVLVVDALGFPRCSFWRAPFREVLEWHERGIMREGRVSRDALRVLFNRMP